MLYYHPAQEGFAREAFKLRVLYVMQASYAKLALLPGCLMRKPHLALSANLCLQKSNMPMCASAPDLMVECLRIAVHGGRRSSQSCLLTQ